MKSGVEFSLSPPFFFLSTPIVMESNYFKNCLEMRHAVYSLPLLDLPGGRIRLVIYFWGSGVLKTNGPQ